MIDHQNDLWRVWGRLEDAVRTNQPVSRSSTALDPDTHRHFIRAMHERALRGGAALAGTLDLTGRHLLFDAGGGAGTYSIFLCQRYPDLRAIVFDLPATVEIAQEVIAGYGLSERISTQAGDYFKDDFGAGNDVVLFSAVLHSLGPDNCRLLLRKAYASLNPGGLVVVHEGLVDRDKTSPLGAVLFSLNMLVNTGEGESWSAEEITSWMEECGFLQPEVKPLPGRLGTALVIGRKAG